MIIIIIIVIVIVIIINNSTISSSILKSQWGKNKRIVPNFVCFYKRIRKFSYHQLKIYLKALEKKKQTHTRGIEGNNQY